MQRAFLIVGITLLTLFVPFKIYLILALKAWHKELTQEQPMTRTSEDNSAVYQSTRTFPHVIPSTFEQDSIEY